jgi:hypothetical protein
MNVLIPSSIYSFTALFSFSLDKRKEVIIPVVLCCLLLCRGPKSFAGLSRTVVTQERNRASFSKLYRRSRFRTRNIYEDALHEVIERLPATANNATPVTWFLIIDGVCTKRGGFAKIENAIKYRRKKKDKGPTTKAHTFIQGLLITHTGVRLPLARRTFYTKSYCRKTGRKSVKMTELAALIVDTVVVPPLVKVVVLADEFFEGRRLDEACRKRGFIYVVPVDSRRCFADSDGKRLSTTLYEYGAKLNRKKLKRIILKPHAERTALLRRRTGSDDNKRVYCATSEIQNVSGLGDVTVVYSWKIHGKARRLKRKWFKVLISNAMDVDVAMLVEYYELRWQIEIFFRELKSFMGLTDFTGQDFSAYERFVDMVLLAYLFLEWYRLQELSRNRSKKDKGALRVVRTATLRQLFQIEADKASIEYFKKCANNPAAVNRLIKLIDNKSMRAISGS